MSAIATELVPVILDSPNTIECAGAIGVGFAAALLVSLRELQVVVDPVAFLFSSFFFLTPLAFSSPLYPALHSNTALDLMAVSR